MKILVIDDEDLVRRALKRALIHMSHEVKDASGGEEGILIWESWKPDIVLLDVLMPSMSGPEVLQKVEKGETKVVLMSAYKGKYDSESAKGLGADDFLAKPFDNVFDVVKVLETSYG